jgi:hypothetical protein
VSIKRPNTQSDDRDTFVTKTPPKGVALQLAAAPDFVKEDCTGRVDLTEDEMAEIRSTRPVDGRLVSLEKWRVEQDKRHIEVVSTLGKMDGKLDTLSTFLGMKTEQDGKTHRARITTNGKALIAIVVAGITTIGTVLVAVLR